jgi:carbon-monoxide dehydrogenase large subunit
MREFGIGRAVPRTEDLRLVRGGGRYTDDIRFPNEAHLYVLRSVEAHARIAAIDTAAAKAAPGVLAVLTGADVVAEGLGTLPNLFRRERRPGAAMPEPPYPVLAHDVVRHVGDGVAAVIAETPAAARDAAELIAVDYETLPSVTATAAAVAPGAPAVWPAAPDNVCFVFAQGDRAAVEAAFNTAAHVVKLDYDISRITTNPMEPRSAIGLYDREQDRYTLYTGSQMPHGLRAMAAGVLRIGPDRLRIVSPDVGGGFGMKGGIFPEQVLTLWAARLTGRPVRWLSDRSEAFISDHHARDNITKAELALDRDGKFLALRVKTLANLGAYLSSVAVQAPTGNLGCLAGVYTTPAILAEVTGVFSNTNPTAPYRGAGRPEAAYVLERLIDVAAAETGIDRVALRRRNLIPADAFPYKTGLVFVYDSGEFEKNMDAVLRMADWAGFEARRAEAAKRGKLRGIGLANAIESAGGPLHKPLEEAAEIRFDRDGRATVLMGTASQGQGHETMFQQLVHHALGLEPEQVTVVSGDTDQVFDGHGTFGSRSMTAGGGAVGEAAEKIVAKGKRIAAHLLEAAEIDIEFAAGTFAVAGTDRRITLVEVARAAHDPARLPEGVEPGLDERAVHFPKTATFPNGSHVCEVEIDPETGTIKIVGYWVVDDVGRVLNPLLVKGQLHGGIVQGIGQALTEVIRYDPASGQMLSGSFMDYAMPRADDVPSFEIVSNEVLTPNNPLGIKGAGEAGTVGALPAVMNAINDALKPLGIRHLEMPATPLRVWQAINAARG